MAKAMKRPRDEHVARLAQLLERDTPGEFFEHLERRPQDLSGLLLEVRGDASPEVSLLDRLRLLRSRLTLWANIQHSALTRDRGVYMELFKRLEKFFRGWVIALSAMNYNDPLQREVLALLRWRLSHCHHVQALPPSCDIPYGGGDLSCTMAALRLLTTVRRRVPRGEGDLDLGTWDALMEAVWTILKPGAEAVTGADLYWDVQRRLTLLEDITDDAEVLISSLADLEQGGLMDLPPEARAAFLERNLQGYAEATPSARQEAR